MFYGYFNYFLKILEYTYYLKRNIFSIIIELSSGLLIINRPINIFNISYHSGMGSILDTSI